MSISTKASFVCWTPGGGRVSFLGQLDSRHVVARKCYQKLVFLFFYFSCILKAFALLLAFSDWTKPQLLQPWMVNTESTCPADIPEEEELAKQSLNKKKRNEGNTQQMENWENILKQFSTLWGGGITFALNTTMASGVP